MALNWPVVEGERGNFIYNVDKNVLSNDSKSNPFIRQISQKCMLTFPGLEDQIRLIIFTMPSYTVITKPLDVDNEITIYSKKPKSM